jgi:hypothetical protein
MVDKTNANPPPDPTQHTSYHLTVPASFQKAHFTEDDYKKYVNALIKSISQEMNKVTNKMIKELKEQRQKIENNE